MEKFSFFNDIDDDRSYYAEDFARHLSKFFTNGIFNNELQVISNNNMTITIKPGDANIEGYRYTNTDNIIKTIDTADGVLKRIDNVVIRLDLTNRLISAQIIKGTFSDNPSAPSLARSTTMYDIKLAEIYINNGATSITQADIKDTRFDKNMCGNVVSAVQTIDTTDVFSQYIAKFEELKQKQENDFSTWFNNVKDTLNNTPVGNLKNLVDIVLKILGFDKDTYSNTATYKLDDLVVYQNVLYYCIVAITTPEEFNINHWKEFKIFNFEEEVTSINEEN